ncbi:hypothetical protein Efla_005402 [Eimeria flavescens]
MARLPQQAFAPAVHGRRQLQTGFCFFSALTVLKLLCGSHVPAAPSNLCLPTTVHVAAATAAVQLAGCSSDALATPSLLLPPHPAAPSLVCTFQFFVRVVLSDAEEKPLRTSRRSPAASHPPPLVEDVGEEVRHQKCRHAR